MARKYDTTATMPLLGGRLCLDFANTLTRPDGGAALDRLHTLQDLIAWGEHAGVLSAETAARYRADAEADPETAALQLERARALRDAVHAALTGEGDLDDAIAVIQRHAGGAEPLRLEAGAEGVRVSCASVLGCIGALVANSVIELLATGARERVKACAGETCRWLFLDESPTGRRRWCSMSLCGNRAKARRHYQAARASG